MAAAPADLRKLDGVYAAPVPAFSELHRHRHGHSGGNSLHDFPGKLRVLHKRRAVPGLDDFPDRAAHVYIQNIRSGKLQRKLRRLRHYLRLVAENLHRAGVFLRRDVQQALGLFVPVHQRPGADHLRHRQRCAQLPANPAKSKIRHPRHRRKGEPALNFN